MIICGSLYITVGNSGRVYAILISRFSYILPMECILIKVIIEDENFTGSKITTKFMRFMSLKNYCMVSYIASYIITKKFGVW